MPEPPSHLDVSRRERGRQRGAVPLGDAPRGAILREHKEGSDARRNESEAFLGKPRRKSRLDVEHPDRLLDRAPLTLRLADHNRARRFMRTEDVDRTTFAPLGKRDLGQCPPQIVLEESDRALDDAGVTCIEQSIESCAIPPRRNPHRSAKPREVVPDVPDVEACDVPILQPPTEMTRAPRSSQVDLAKAQLLTKSSRRPPKPLVVARHWPMLRIAAYPGLSGELPAALLGFRQISTEVDLTPSHSWKFLSVVHARGVLALNRG